MEIKNLKKLSQRIKKAIKNKERIILYADADMDGISSAIILSEAIENLGGRVFSFYFPSREREGYGLNFIALKKIKKFAPAFLITLDCGISNFEEVEEAKRLGFEVVVADHHQPLGRLPKASIVVDPKQKGDKYPFKELANTGIIFKLAQLLLKDKMTDHLRKDFLELTALATMVDMMPRVNENKLFIDEGILSLKESWRPGIQALFTLKAVKQARNYNSALSQIISILSVVEEINGLPAIYLLLRAPSLKEAKEIAEKLALRKKERQKELFRIVSLLQEKISSQEPLIFEQDPAWEVALIGGIASRLYQKYKKPVFLIARRRGKSRGAVRTPEDVNGVDLMKKCSKYLLSYGGHPRAGGFLIENKKIKDFKACLAKQLLKRKN